MARCDSYDAGECTRGACLAEGWIPDGLGNANQWFDRARARGFATTDQPTIAAVAIFTDRGLYSRSAGHCAIVEDVYSYQSFKVLEMNFAAFGEYDQRTCTREGLIGFVLAPGVAAGTGAGQAISGPGDPQGQANWAWGRLAQWAGIDLRGYHDRNYHVRGLFDGIGR